MKQQLTKQHDTAPALKTRGIPVLNTKRRNRKKLGAEDKKNYTAK